MPNSTVSQITLPSGTTYDIKDYALSGIYSVIGTQSASTSSWTGNINVSALSTGTTIAYYLPYASTSTSVTLNLTLSTGTTTGAIDCYYTGTSRITTHYGAGSTIILTYYAAGDISVAGTATTVATWRARDYDSTNTYQLRDYYGRYKTYTALYRYQICLTKDEENVLPVNTVNNSTATTKTLTTESFNPFGQIYYYNSTTADQAAGGNIPDATLYMQILADLRYSFNTGTTLTARKGVYLVAVPQSDGSAKLYTSPITQTLPTTEDGRIYIYLGQAYDTYRMELQTVHPVYHYVSGSIRIYTHAPDVTITSTYDSSTSTVTLFVGNITDADNISY